MSKNRLVVLNTYHLFIGGKFPPGESGRNLTATSADAKAPLANHCQTPPSIDRLREKAVSHFASYMNVNAILDGCCLDAAQSGAAINLKRFAPRDFATQGWFPIKAEDPCQIPDTVEFNTGWHPIGF